MKRKNPVIFGREVNPWLLGGLGASVLLLLVSRGGEIVAMVKETLDNAKRTEAIRALAKERGIPEAVALAIFTIESGGAGFKNGRMVIRFEPGYFKKYTGQEIAVLRSGQDGEWDNFNRASAIDADAAMKSISMGSAQIMGANYKMIGFPSVKAMFDAFSTDERSQIKGFFDFVKAAGIEDAARTGDWTKFARKYNGPAQKGYDTKMASLYKQFVGKGYEGIA